jgi:hypothetical protein
LKPRLTVLLLRDRVVWCRKHHKAWTEGKPGSVASMESHLNRFILPRFGDWQVSAITETAVAEFIADLRRGTLERKDGKGRGREAL